MKLILDAGRRKKLPILGMLAVLLFPNLAGHAGETDTPPADSGGAKPPHLFILSFDAWGELQNPAERDFAREQLEQNRGIERIIVLAYGWANDGQASYATYRRLVEEIMANAPLEGRKQEIAVIAVGWDSSQSGFRKLTHDIVPLPGIGEAIAWAPDKIAFPISFWSKAAQADRIGFGGLREALNEILSVYETPEAVPEIYLLGHSFGTRIVSGLVNEDVAGVKIGATPFKFADRVRGVGLLQPALVLENLYEEADYPVLATMSQHDHAVGFLYPIANVPLNSLGFSVFEALVQARFLGRIEKGVGTATSTAGHLLPPSPLQAKTADGGRAGAPRGAVDEPIQRGLRRGWRTLGEVLALPLNLAFTIVMTPLDYAYVQGTGFFTHPISHTMDSLAQVPIVEIPVETASRLLGHEVIWGQRSKGIFGLGPIHEGVGRMVSPRLLVRRRVPVYSLKELEGLAGPPKGVFVVDATPIVRRGLFGADLGNPWVNYTIGWLDPIGAHGDYTNAEVVGLMAWVANGTPIKAAE